MAEPLALCVHQSPIAREPVASGNIASTGYAAEPLILAVQFTSGAVYHYVGVPADLHAELMHAKSKGGCFARAIRGKFATVKLGESCSICTQPRAVDMLVGS